MKIISYSHYDRTTKRIQNEIMRKCGTSYSLATIQDRAQREYKICIEERSIEKQLVVVDNWIECLRLSAVVPEQIISCDNFKI